MGLWLRAHAMLLIAWSQCVKIRTPLRIKTCTSQLRSLPSRRRRTDRRPPPVSSRREESNCTIVYGRSSGVGRRRELRSRRTPFLSRYWILKKLNLFIPNCFDLLCLEAPFNHIKQICEVNFIKQKYVLLSFHQSIPISSLPVQLFIA